MFLNFVLKHQCLQKPGKGDQRMLNEIINYLSSSTSFRGWLSFPDYGTSALYYTPCLEVELRGWSDLGNS